MGQQSGFVCKFVRLSVFLFLIGGWTAWGQVRPRMVQAVSNEHGEDPSFHASILGGCNKPGQALSVDETGGSGAGRCVSGGRWGERRYSRIEGMVR
jgi:hypothetical protein